MVTLLSGGSKPTLRERIDESLSPTARKQFRKWFYYLIIPLITLLHVHRSLENGQRVLVWIVAGSAIMVGLISWYEVFPRLRGRKSKL